MLNINNINLYNSLTLVKNNKKDSSGISSDFKYRYNCSHDVIDFKNKNTVSFSGQNLSKALKYVQEVKSCYKNKGIKPILDDFNLYKLDGILEGTVFDGIPMEDFATLCDNLENILLIRGCSNHCGHCFASAKSFKPDVTGEINTIIWEDFKNLADSIEKISKRLEFNPLRGFSNRFYPFHDSDPLHLKSYDDKGKSHNIAEAVEYFYNKTGMLFHITTAGWDKEEIWVQKAAEELTENTLKIPDSINSVMISIHPFHKYMTKSIELEKASRKIEYAERKDFLEEQSQKYRQKYIDRMANVLKTFLPLFKKDKAAINLLYAPDQASKTEYSQEVSKQLFKEIIDKLEKICKPEELSDKDKEILLNNLDKTHQILANGKAKRFFSPSEISQPRFYSVNNELSIDINGKVFIINSPQYTYPPMGIQLNYRNKNKLPHKFSRIKSLI